MDPDSIISTTGKGNLKGAGFVKSDGASYAGQGGSQAKNCKQVTYGSFDQTPDESNLHIDQMGSGNNDLGELSHRGGGVISINAK